MLSPRSAYRSAYVRCQNQGIVFACVLFNWCVKSPKQILRHSPAMLDRYDIFQSRVIAKLTFESVACKCQNREQSKSEPVAWMKLSRRRVTCISPVAAPLLPSHVPPLHPCFAPRPHSCRMPKPFPDHPFHIHLPARTRNLRLKRCTPSTPLHCFPTHPAPSTPTLTTPPIHRSLRPRRPPLATLLDCRMMMGARVTCPTAVPVCMRGLPSHVSREFSWPRGNAYPGGVRSSSSLSSSRSAETQLLFL